MNIFLKNKILIKVKPANNYGLNAFVSLFVDVLFFHNGYVTPTVTTGHIVISDGRKITVINLLKFYLGH